MSVRFVLDSSLALSWCFDDEATGSTQKILDLFEEGGTAYVPALWAWEVNNTLCLAEKAKRLTAAERLEKSSLLQRLTIELDDGAHRQSWSATATLAQAHKLSVYDAAYLEMAIRLHAPLGTLDKDLRAAARREGIKLLPAERKQPTAAIKHSGR